MSLHQPSHLRSLVLTTMSLDAAYHFEQCPPAVAEVELYRIIDAPPMLVNRRGIEYPNGQAKVMHAHRRPYPEFDGPPNRGCSSKLANGPLIAHNRWALGDARPYGSRNPRISYGSIYQHWRRTLNHPSFPGKEHNLVRPTGHYPNDPIFMSGHGRRPPGHPGNTIGLPGYHNGNNNLPEPASSALSEKWQPLSRSRRKYAQVPRMRAHDPIPLPSRAAEESAVKGYEKIRKASPKLVTAFENCFYAWQKTWYRSAGAPSSA